MIARLTLVQRRILAVLLLLLAVGVVVRVIVVPVWTTYVDNRDAIIQMEETIVRYSRLSAQVESLRLALGEAQDTDELDRYTLAQESEPLAAAALQERVKSVVTDSGGTLTSTQVLPTEAEQGFKRIIVNVRMAVTIDTLQRVLYELETGLPYLLVDDIIVLARGARRRRASTQSLGLLDVRLNLHAFMRDPGEPV